jgi:uncharacterized protein
MELFTWINDYLLKMNWLKSGIEAVISMLGFDTAGNVGASLTFFIYDTIKIFILLSVLIFMVSYIQSYFPPERTRRILGRFKGIGANVLAALLGTITPFCSCSSIPLFIGFTSAGLPIGMTFSFLISSPLVDLASVLLLVSIFNWKIAVTYVLVGLLLAVVGGTLLSTLKMEDQIEEFVFQTPLALLDETKLSRKDRISFSTDQVREIFHKVWPYVLIGVGIGALIHNWIPESWILALLGQDKWYSVPLATLIGVPMYADIFGTLPIAEALVAKGVGIGTVLSFMMAVTALSVPSIVMLKNVVKPKLLAIFVLYVTVGIMLIGFVLNAFGSLLI